MATKTTQFSTKIRDGHKRKLDKIKEATGFPICRLLEQWIDRAFSESIAKKRRAS